ncbi:hypothetical protein GCM10010193_37490 [Kitasatospora atroaurantiaca]|uniref:transposase n=1 Tax=Kitasatospora atroaurantiaca TaxID=285545 RepID=UPI00337A382E
MLPQWLLPAAPPADSVPGRRQLVSTQVEAYLGWHPDAEIIRSQPGLGPMLSARVLAEFGDDPHRYASAKARKNYAGTSPIARASGRKKVVTARFVRNDRLIDALIAQAFSALRVSSGTTTPTSGGPRARTPRPPVSGLCGTTSVRADPR